VKRQNRAFTIVEIVTVVTIIAILMGILLPAITTVKKMVKNTEQQAQLATIALAIQAFKNDYGQYPESDYRNLSNNDYSGAQMLTEALLGWDLMGFHPDSTWDAENRDDVYKTDSSFSDTEREKNLEERKGPYLERSDTKVFHIGDLFKSANIRGLESDESYVISDVFRYKKIPDRDTDKTVTAGSPVLYYRARPHKKLLDSDDWEDSIYDYMDNRWLIAAKSRQDIVDKRLTEQHKLVDSEYFYEEYIADPKISRPDDNRYWPYRPDSYLLISAGYDGEYGTEDDITNFK